MLFIFVFVIGLIFPFLFIKLSVKVWTWIPAILLLLATIVMGVKAQFFPAAEMAVLGEIVYAMLFATSAGGALVGGIIVHLWKRK